MNIDIVSPWYVHYLIRYIAKYAVESSVIIGDALFQLNMLYSGHINTFNLNHYRTGWLKNLNLTFNSTKMFELIAKWTENSDAYGDQNRKAHSLRDSLIL